MTVADTRRVKVAIDTCGEARRVKSNKFDFDYTLIGSRCNRADITCGLVRTLGVVALGRWRLSSFRRAEHRLGNRSGGKFREKIFRDLRMRGPGRFGAGRAAEITETLGENV